LPPTFGKLRANRSSGLTWRPSLRQGHLKTEQALFPDSFLTVDVGPGNGDFLSVTNCTGDRTTLQDTGGANGLLIKSGNNFASETDTGFSTII
jgi:hypothetical protein